MQEGILMAKTKEIEFAFSILSELLDEVAPNIKPTFIALKDNPSFLFKAESNLLQELSSQEISNLIKAFAPICPNSNHARKSSYISW